jgi:hypothetical protein
MRHGVASVLCLQRRQWRCALCGPPTRRASRCRAVGFLEPGKLADRGSCGLSADLSPTIEPHGCGIMTHCLDPLLLLETPMIPGFLARRTCYASLVGMTQATFVRRCLLAIVTCGLASCVDVGSSSGELAAVKSDSGSLSIVVATVSGASLDRGTNSLEFEITSAGAGVDGLSLDVTPWMPAMGHGASVKPSVHAEGQGKYLVENVELFMPGLWQLQTTFSNGVSDHAAPSFEVE